ncbi:MAG: translation initiation factor IF-2 [Myxococcota bacterium]
MAKIRAYKLAEELGLEKEEFLKKAAALGVELRSHLVGLDEEQVELLRRRLGGIREQDRDEKRVGSTVIRRRRRKVEPLPPESASVAPEPEPVAASAEPAVTEPAPEVSEESQAEPDDAAAAADSQAPPLAEAPVVPEPRPLTPERPASSPVTGPAAGPPSRTAERLPDRPPARKLTRRKVLEGVALREQDQLSRSMRGNVQQRLEQRRLVVEQQSRVQSARRRPVASGRPPPTTSARPRKLELKLAGPVTFAELSRLTGVKLRDLHRRARALGAELDRDALIDVETAQLLAEEAGFSVRRVEGSLEESVAAALGGTLEDLDLRPPVVTVMGHVDHGKTTLLDRIRQTNVVDSESGGITQHIGAYQVEAAGHRITFLDTPGHAAFTQMRARGASVTDIAILVVAADDGIMPQTVEAISHARAAGVPILVAINKIDRPDANPQRVKQALLEHDLVPEEFGGEVICVEVSAKEGTNIEKLLEMLALQAEVLELRARAKGAARGTVIEAELDRGRGPLATVLVREGQLRRGDAVVIGSCYGRVRALMDDRGGSLKEAGPSAPVRIVGLSGVPGAGEEMIVVRNEREAKEIVEQRVAEERRARGEAASAPATDQAEDLFAALEAGEQKELRLVIKADVHGTREAIVEAVCKLSSDDVKVAVIHSGVGAITESDVMLASASHAVVIGFHVRPEAVARHAAERENVNVRSFDIVYELLDDVQALAQGLLPPKLVEQVTGHAEVRELFVIPRVGTVAGCYVPEGVIRRSNLVRVVRNGVPIYSGRLASLRRFKEDVREVSGPIECGMKVENFDDVKVGDVLESYVVEETRANR